MKKILIAATCFATIFAQKAVINAQQDFTATLTLNRASNYEVSYLVINNDTEILLKLAMKANNGAGFMGFGFPEQTSGGMPGSDIVTVRKSGANVIVEDRNVPFDPYPIDRFDPEFASLDRKQPSDWVLVSSESNATHWSATIKRKLITNDPDDREILLGSNGMKFIYAWSETGSAVAYHGNKRGNGRINFKATSLPTVPIPEDADGSFDLLLSNYSLPNSFEGEGEDTFYVCQTFDTASFIDLEDGDRHVVVIEPFVQPENKHYVHHFLIHACGNNDSITPLDVHPPGASPNVCMAQGTGTSPLTFGACTTLFYAWAVGGEAIVLPETAGMRIGLNSTRYIIVEIHYDNPALTSGIVDSSGVRVHYTAPEDLREHDAITLSLGLFGGDDYLLTAGQGSQHREVTCASSCTSRFLGPLNVITSFLHMHGYGKQIWTTQYSEGNLTKKTIRNRIDYWNFEHQENTLMNNYTILPGDQLSVHGVYDLRDSDHDVVFGTKSKEEMLFDFLLVYPAANLNNIFRCTRLSFPSGPPPAPLFVATACGDDVNPGLSNPVPDGDTSLPYRFGQEASALPNDPGPTPTTSGSRVTATCSLTLTNLVLLLVMSFIFTIQ